MTALAVAREALAREGRLEARLGTLAQAASQSGARMFTLPEARQAPSLPAQRRGQVLRFSKGQHLRLPGTHVSEAQPVWRASGSSFAGGQG